MNSFTCVISKIQVSIVVLFGRLTYVTHQIDAGAVRVAQQKFIVAVKNAYQHGIGCCRNNKPKFRPYLQLQRHVGLTVLVKRRSQSTDSAGKCEQGCGGLKVVASDLTEEEIYTSGLKGAIYCPIHWLRGFGPVRYEE
jgi:hypothetical protein